jgi:DNA-binding response OmpR family regulator
MEGTGGYIRLQSEENRMSKPRKRILMVEDDVDVSRLNTEELRHAGYLVDNVEDGADAWNVLQRASYHLLITDQHWPKLSGVELLKQIRDAHMAMPIIMVTDILPRLEFAEHPWIQPATMLLEPYSSAELLAMVKKALSANAGVEGNIAPSPTLKSQPVDHGQ